MNTNNTNVPDTKPLTRKQKRWRRYREYLNKKKLKKNGFVYDNDSDEELICRDLSRICYYDSEYQGLHRIVAQIYAEQNSETHKQKIYDELDKFISENEPAENIGQFDISGRDYCDGKKMYNKMKNDNPKYEIFGSNGGGYTCFGLYKSKDQNIYIIKVIVQIPTDYVKIEDDTIFG
jgi:hypothetical protein